MKNKKKEIEWNKKTEANKQRALIQNIIWDKGKDRMKQLIEYVKKYVILYNMKDKNKNAIKKEKKT
jgi:hypothetical protein